MNCYGYAFCNILQGTAVVDLYGGYKQLPGEFASTEDKCRTSMNIVANNSSASLNRIISNMQLDGDRLGYTLTRFTPYSNIVPQLGTSSRLIAVVTGNYDFHYYMQHSDGTWSHKPGSSSVTNRSIISDEVLTNANIISFANEGAYAGGSLAFFVITKNAVMDKPHGSRCCYAWPCSGHTQSNLYYREEAGDYLPTSVNAYIGTITSRFDYSFDHDVYCFTPTTTRTYSISTLALGSSDIDCIAYNENGEQIGISNNDGDVSLSLTLIANHSYYFDIYNYSEIVTMYKFSII